MLANASFKTPEIKDMGIDDHTVLTSLRRQLAVALARNDQAEPFVQALAGFYGRFREIKDPQSAALDDQRALRDTQIRFGGGPQWVPDYVI